MSSVDILFHLRKEEYVRRMSEIHSVIPGEHEAPATDAMANLCRHVVEQKRSVLLIPLIYTLADSLDLKLLPHLSCTTRHTA